MILVNISYPLISPPLQFSSVRNSMEGCSLIAGLVVSATISLRGDPPDSIVQLEDDEWQKNSTSKKTPSVPIVERSPEANANDDGVPGKSTPPVEESPTPKSKSKAVPVPGVCLAPDDDEDWDVDDIYERMPSIQTSSEHEANDDDDAQQSVPYE